MADDDLDDLFGDFLETDEGGGESSDPSAPRSGKRALIFVCDANSAMLRHDRIVEDDYGEMPSEPNSSPLERAMKIAFLSCKWRLMTSPNDLIGVVLYNTEQTKNEHGFDNISVMQPLSGITVNFMKELRSFQSNPKAALDEFGGSKDPKGGDTALDQALWLCSFLFSGANLKSFDEQMVWLFTNNDNPHNGDTALRTKLVKRFEDCFQANQGINVWPLVPRTQFKESRFFESALEPGKQTRSDADEEGEECEFLKAGVVYDVREDGGSYHDNDLEKLVNRRNFAKRRTVPLTLDLGNNLSLGLDFFAPIMPASLPLPQQLDGKELHVVKRQTTHVCQDSLNELTPDQISHFFEFGDSRVFVRREEVKQLRNFGKPKTLKALGFKPSSSIKPWYALRSPYFAIPSEKELEGSTMAFIALLNTMIEKDVVLYVAGTLRANEVVKLMALIPRPEKVKTIEGEAFVQELPGFDVIVLPWANDIRELKLEPKPVLSEQPSAEHIDKAKAMINHFNLLEDEESGRYHPVQNPHLARHFQALEYVAMRNTGYGDASIESDDEYDETRPLEVSDAQRQAIGDFAALCPPESMEESVSVQKRKTADSKAAPTKRVKKEPAAKPDPSEWRTLAAENKLSKLTVAQLKAICKEAGVAISGNKTALVERIEEVAAGSEADEGSDQDVVMASPSGESDQGDDSDNDDGKGGKRTKVGSKPSKGRKALPSRATRRRGTQSSRARTVDTDSSDDEGHSIASHSSHSEAEANQEFGEGPGHATEVPKKKPLRARPSRRAAALAEHDNDDSDEDATQKRATGLTGASGSDSEIELYSD